MQTKEQTFEGDILNDGYFKNLSEQIKLDVLKRIDEENKEKEKRLKINVGLPQKTEQPCLHYGCSECHGTGRKKSGGLCFHFISCPCKKCSPYSLK